MKIGKKTSGFSGKTAVFAGLILALFATPSFGVGGDVDNSRRIDLQDTIISLKICAGMSEDVSLDGDANNDGSIGLEEAIYAMQVLAELRESPVVGIGPHPRMFLTQNRLNEMNDKMTNDPDGIWTYFTGRLEHFLGDNPYANLEFSLAYALGYRLTGNTAYRDRSIDLVYNVVDGFNPSNTWYESGNDFRRYAWQYCIFFDWIYDELTAAKKTEALNAFRQWGAYWQGRVNYDNDFDGYYEQDSDAATSLVENFLMLGIAMYDETGYESDANLMLEISDTMMDRFLVGLYMDDYMRGGIWAEGARYNSGTCKHWIRAFMVNRETRGIPYPNDYLDLNMTAEIYNTVPGYTSMYLFGDLEDMEDNASTPDTNEGDYIKPGFGEYDQYDYMITLYDAIDDATVKSLGQDWLNTIKAKGLVSYPGSVFSGVWRMLFEKPDAPAQSPADLGLPLEFVADGVMTISMRDNWTENANAIWFHNSKWNVDHMEHDALSFQIYRNGIPVSRECSGYGGISDETFSHNSILVENKDNWGGNVGYHAAGQGEYTVTSFNSGFNYIEAEAADVYNYRVWNGVVQYVDNINRKFVWIKPDYVVVYDYVKLVDDGVTTPDGDVANLYDGHKRRVRYVQHFQAEPMLSGGVYSASWEGQKLFFKTLLPTNASVTKINEKTDPRFDAAGWQMSDNQKKWHLEVAYPTAINENRLLHVLYFDADTVATMPQTQEITVTGNMVGAHIMDASENCMVLFGSEAPGTQVDSVQYTLTSTAPSRHILGDMRPNTQYTVDIAGSPQTVTSDNDGILTFTDSTSGSKTYDISM